MEKRCIFAPDGPPAMGPYSHAVAAGNFLFLSGFGPANKDGVQRGSIEDEARLSLSNVKCVLEAAGSSLDKVVKVTVYLANMDHFAAFNEIYKEFFTANYPARTCIQAGRLPMDIQVEIEAVALLP